MSATKPLAITDVVLRDGSQSLLATRLRIEDMLPIAAKLDQVGYWSLETWGGAVFDACIRYLGEDPWERLRLLKGAMPNTRQQMLLRGQNLLGYRHYSDDVVQAFVERSAENGIDVFRIFDAMNDTRNLETAVRAVLATGRHAQGTLSYTVSPAHDLNYWLEMARRLEGLGCHSICIKDMAGLLRPYLAFELVSRLKETVSLPIAMHSHATTGMSTATGVKAVEAGLDMLDTSISSMSMSYGHSATEAVVAIFEGTGQATGLDLKLLEEIAAWFRKVRKKYLAFEGALKGVDSRILVAQVPGGMLTNMENQLREQGAEDRFDAVLEEIPKVREELGYIPLVTPTSQIVGTQAVLNVLTGERYRTITKETSGLLRGEYGATPAPVDAALQARVLAGAEPVTCRPADLLSPELEQLSEALEREAAARNLKLADNRIEDVLIHALFPQIGLRFIENRGNPAAFEPAPSQCETSAPESATASDTSTAASATACYTVTVNGVAYAVQVAPGGALTQIAPATAAVPPSGDAHRVRSPLAGTVFQVLAREGQEVSEGETLVILEAMKMETEIKAPKAGSVRTISVKSGDTVRLGDPLVELS